MSKEAIEVVFGTSFFCLRKARSTLRTTLSEDVKCFSSKNTVEARRVSTMRKTHAEAALYSTTTSPASAHDSQAPSWMETGASQCIHDLLPARRVELHRGARGVEALANAFINASGERGPVDALAFQSRLTSGRRLWRASQILVSLPGTNARLAASGLPQPLTGHRLPLVSRGERDSTGTVLWAFFSGDPR